ncbi:helix-turn-helix domain-containing protein [Pseudarthrobacter sp. H2]|uniref:helix-turn-helix domain-containing protein n=1 Tax=Pseudarthrobacter sp. H2 TaxID=3418415 RepID=UPI003CEF5B9B
MFTSLYARPPRDPDEERKIRMLAGARHAPADWIRRARMITGSWAGKPVSVIAAELGCHTKTVRERLHRFNAEGLDGLGDKPISGRPRRLSEDERSRIIALAGQAPPGRLVRDSQGDLAAAEKTGAPEWTLDTLTDAARAAGIEVHRSQVRRILLAEGVRWRHTRSWIRSKDPDFVPKGHGSSSSTPARPRARRSSASMNSAR